MRSAVLAATLCATLGCATGPTEITDLDLALDRWAAQGITRYSYVLDPICFCAGPTGPYRIAVRDGAVHSVTGAAGHPLSLDHGVTLDSLYQRLRRNREQGRLREVSFDGRGVLRSATVGTPETDAGVIYRVSAFRRER